MKDTQRVTNALRRLAAGLPPRQRLLAPETPTDLYRAHLSLYHFAGQRAGGTWVLDLGSGTGYGSDRLKAAGAAAVVGLEPSRLAVLYARRRFARDGVTFVRAPIERPPESLPAIETLVAVNTLPRTAEPAALVDRLVPAGGSAVVAVPPILDGPSLSIHRRLNPWGSNLYLFDWYDLLAERFGELELYCHAPPAGEAIDLASPAPSALDPERFRFDRVPEGRIDEVSGLAAVFVLRDKR